MKNIKLGILTAALAVASLANGQSSSRRISDLAPITNAQIAVGDVFPVSDISASQTKKLSFGELDLRYLNQSGDTVSGKLTVLNNLNGGFEVQSVSGSAGLVLKRTTSSVGSFYLGAAGDRDSTNLYDELQFRQGQGLGVSFKMRETDAGVQTLFWGSGSDAYMARTASGDLGTYTGGSLRGGFFNDGAFRLYGGTSGYTGIQASSSVTSYNVTLPALQGATGTTLVNNGSGTLSWQPLSGATPSVRTFTSGSQLYTTPANVKYLEIKVIGGGGGGGGSNGAGAGAAGGTSSFGTSLLTATGGGAGGEGVQGGAGGSVTVNSPAIDRLSSAGGWGGAGAAQVTGGVEYAIGANGGASCIGGAGAGGGANNATNGANGAANSGAGGGGAGKGTAGSTAGAGGGAGGCIDAIIVSPAATYPAIVGAGGGGASGAGNGAAGKIAITEFYF